MKSTKLKNHVFLLSGFLVILLSACGTEKRLYAAGEEWSRHNPIILEDTGGVIEVKPIGKREVDCFFTDGCISRFQLEVVGKEGTGLLKVLDYGTTYPTFASWHWKGEQTSIHGETGMSFEEYYSLPNYLKVLTSEVEKGRSQNSLYKRAIVNWLLGNKIEAYEDINESIGLEEEHKQGAINPKLYRPFREAFRVLALFQTFDGDYDLALKTAESIIKSHEDNGSDVIVNDIADDYFLRWFIQVEAGDFDVANRMLLGACRLPEDMVSESLSGEENVQRMLEKLRKINRCNEQFFSLPSIENYNLYITGQYAELETILAKEIERIDDNPYDFDSQILLAKELLLRIDKANQPVDESGAIP
jgi:hypothetical protein